MSLLLETIILLLMAFGTGLFVGSLIWEEPAGRP